MASETVANLLDLLKEVWTQNRMEKQFYDKNLWLDKVEKTNRYTIGREALVPIEKSLPGGASTKSAAGGTLNPADALHVDRADYDLVYQWQQISIETGALAQADSVGMRSTVDAQDQTVTSNLAAMRRELGRQFVSNQDGFIAQCDTGGASTTVELLATGYGYDAIVRGWLRVGQQVDIGTAADPDTIVAQSGITAVKESSTDPDITIEDSVTTGTTHYVSIAGAHPTGSATSLEANGLRQIAGSTTLPVGGLDPDTAGEEFWQPAHVDTSTTLASLDLLLTLQRKVFQKTGVFPTFVTTSAYQAASLYSQFQSQVRFDSDKTGAGNAHGFTWNGMDITVDPDIPDRELYMLTLSDFFVVTGGQFSKPTWASDIEGAGGRLRWAQGATNFVDALVYPVNLAIKRRNSHAAAIGLTA